MPAEVPHAGRRWAVKGLHRNREKRRRGWSVVAVPWLSYIPVPGMAFVAVWADPDDRLTRYHAWQGGLLVVAVYVLLISLGLLVRLSDAAGYLATMGLLSGLLLLGGLAGIVWGMVGALRRRYVRVRPVWDVLASLRSGDAQ